MPTASGTANKSPVRTVTARRCLAISTPIVPPTRPPTIVLPPSRKSGLFQCASVALGSSSQNASRLPIAAPAIAAAMHPAARPAVDHVARLAPRREIQPETDGIRGGLEDVVRRHTPGHDDAQRIRHAEIVAETVPSYR